MNPNDPNAERFLNLLRASRRGKFKVYMGMSAGVGKSYRMLQEAHALLKGSIEVTIGFIETPNRAETQALLNGLLRIPRRRLFYKGRELDEAGHQRRAPGVYPAAGGAADPVTLNRIRQHLFAIDDLNRQAIGRKSRTAEQTATHALAGVRWHAVFSGCFFSSSTFPATLPTPCVN